MDPSDASAVLAIAGAAEASDGVAPLDESMSLAVRRRPESVRAIVREAGFALAYDGQLAVVVLPEDRGHGVGTALAAALLDGTGDGHLRAWMHGESPAARRLAARFGFTAGRELWVMRLDHQGGPTERTNRHSVPHGVALRGFAPGDEPEILRVNAAAFSWHPEQGSMDLADLHERMAEPWFEPAGLIEAWEGAALLGFHWTKRHPGTPDGRTHGEVYVVTVDPAAQGRGLGRLLTVAGLEHLSDCDEVHLYVESDNAAAVRLYGSLGFTHAPADTHVMFHRPGGETDKQGRRS
ncbi:MAG: mycothiol synthase [Nocardioides sp.]|uniref:mycothiol synthase n=1 Tax=Nocardioides sp. TaxID=35761 RepID=UPI0039E456FC